MRLASVLPASFTLNVQMQAKELDPLSKIHFHYLKARLNVKIN